jgi:hypothetical protein
MSQATPSGRPNRRAIVYSLVAVVALQVVVIAGLVGYERASQSESPGRNLVMESRHVFMRPEPPKPVIQPPIVKASQSTMQPDEPVIGVELGGKARAYRLASFRDDTHHLVNDMIGGVPVSVVYCNLSHCVRVFTDPLGSKPLDAQTVGLVENQMVINVKGTWYFHNSSLPVKPSDHTPPFPFKQLAPRLTTWKEWIAEHPESDVYEGIVEAHGPDRRPRSPDQ